MRRIQRLGKSDGWNNPHQESPGNIHLAGRAQGREPKEPVLLASASHKEGILLPPLTSVVPFCNGRKQPNPALPSYGLGQ